MKRSIAFGLLMALTAATVLAAKTGATFYGSYGLDEGKIKTLFQRIAPLGYRLSDPHEKINEGYKAKYNESTLDTLNFFSVSNDRLMHDILEKTPRMGLFAPFDLYVYKLTGDNTMWIGRLEPETMMEIGGLQNPALRNAFTRSIGQLDALVRRELDAKKEMTLHYDQLPQPAVMTYEFPFAGETEKFIERFQERYEAAFEAKEYIIAGYKDYRDAWASEGLDSSYDAYWTYLLCHFRFSNSVFNRGNPEPGIFAPCTVYMYIPRGEKTLYVGLPRLENWIAIAGVTDPAKVRAIRELEKEIDATFRSLLTDRDD